MYTLDSDTYSCIVQSLPIDAINHLRLTTSSNFHQLSTLRNSNNFWKLRLEKFLDIQITCIPTSETWHQVYTKITAGELNLSQKLSIFARLGDLPIVQLLLESGADITTDDNLAIRTASGNGHVEVVKLLLAAGADVTTDDNLALRAASMTGHVEVVKLLLAAGADVPAQYNTALHLASITGRIEVVELLLEAGADVTSGDNFAIRVASINGHFQVVQLLRDTGATP